MDKKTEEVFAIFKESLKMLKEKQFKFLSSLFKKRENVDADELRSEIKKYES